MIYQLHEIQHINITVCKNLKQQKLKIFIFIFIGFKK